MANGGAVRQDVSDVDTFSNAQSIFKFDAEIALSTVDFRVTEQQSSRLGPRAFSIRVVNSFGGGFVW